MKKHGYAFLVGLSAIVATVVAAMLSASPASAAGCSYSYWYSSFPPTVYANSCLIQSYAAGSPAAIAYAQQRIPPLQYNVLKSNAAFLARKDASCNYRGVRAVVVLWWVDFYCG